MTFSFLFIFLPVSSVTFAQVQQILCIHFDYQKNPTKPTYKYAQLFILFSEEKLPHFKKAPNLKAT